MSTILTTQDKAVKHIQSKISEATNILSKLTPNISSTDYSRALVETETWKGSTENVLKQIFSDNHIANNFVEYDFVSPTKTNSLFQNISDLSDEIKNDIIKLNHIITDLNAGLYAKSNEKGGISKGIERLIVFIFGVAFITTILVIAIFIPEPKPFQWNIFKTVLALAGAGIAAFIPGFIEVEINKLVRAGGALAVFVLLFFYNPANLVVNYKEVTKKYDLLSFRLGEDITTTDIVINQVTEGDSSDIAEIKNTAKKRLDIIQNSADQLGLKINLNNLFETTNSKHNLFPQSKFDYVIDGLSGLNSRNTVSYFRIGWYLTWIYVEGSIVTDSTAQKEHPEFLKEFLQLYPKVSSDLNSDLKSLGYDERVPEKFTDIDEIKNKTAKAKEAVLKQLEN